MEAHSSSEPSSPLIVAPPVAQPPSNEAIEKLKNDLSALCSSIVQLRLQDRASIELLQRDTDWMHSLSLLALLFHIGPAQPLDSPSATMEILAAEVRRLAERCDFLEGRQGGAESSTPVEQTMSIQQPPMYENVGGDPIVAFVAPQEVGMSSATLQLTIPSNPTSVNQSTYSNRTYLYIHTRINPPFVTLTPTQRAHIRSIVDPQGVGMRLLDLPRFHLLSTGEIIVCLEDEEAATRAKNRLTTKLFPILRKTYIVRWPGTPIPCLVFKITSIFKTPSTTPSFRQMLRDVGGARKRFLAKTIMDAFPILRANTANQHDEEKFLADADSLLLALEGSSRSFAEDFASMNPRIEVEGITIVVSAFVASDVSNWRNKVVDWNTE